MNMYIHIRNAVQSYSKEPTNNNRDAGNGGNTQKSNMPEAKLPLFMASEEGS
jgi:hypothetical protein